MSQPSVNLLDLMSEEDANKARVKAEKREARASEVITAEYMLLAELGVYYGWEAIMAVLDDTITLPQARMFIEGGRKLHSSDVFDSAVAGVAANAKKKSHFEKLMKPFITNMKVIT